MRATLRVLRAELGRLARMRSNWSVLLLLCAAAALRAWVSVGSTVVERGGKIDPLSSGRAWAPLVDGWRAGLVLGALVLVAFAARFVAGDLESGVLRLSVTRSVSRLALIQGRLLLAPFLVLSIVICTGLSAWLVARASGDFGPLVEDGFEIFSRAELRHEILIGAVAILPAMLATYAFGLFVSSLVPGSTLAVSAALGLYLGFDLFKEMLGPARNWIFATHVPTLDDSSAWHELPGVVRGFSDAGYSSELLRAALISPWPALLFFWGCTWLVLSRKSL